MVKYGVHSRMEGEFIEIYDFVWNISLEFIKLYTQRRCKGYGIERVVGLGLDRVESVTTAWC